MVNQGGAQKLSRLPRHHGSHYDLTMIVGSSPSPVLQRPPAVSDRPGTALEASGSARRWAYAPLNFIENYKSNTTK